MPRLSFPLAAATLAINALPLAGQASLRTSGGVAQLERMPMSPVGELALDARLRHGPIAGMLAGSLANFQDYGTGSSIAGRIGGRVTRGPFQLVAGPTVSAGRVVSGQWARAAGGGVTAGLESGVTTVTVRWDEGAAWRPDDNRVTWSARSATASVSLGAAVVKASWTGTVVRDSVLRDDVFFAPGHGGGDLFRPRIRDAHHVSIGALLDLEYFAVDGNVGSRWGDDISSMVTWNVEAAMPLSSGLALVLTSSQVPADLALGLPGNRSFTMGFRLGGIAGMHPAMERRPVLEIIRESDNMVRLVIRLPSGSRVRLMGEMTGWQVVELESHGRGRFSGLFAVAPGTYRLNIAIDGGPWTVPPGMPVVDDGFGGLVGLAGL